MSLVELSWQSFSTRYIRRGTAGCRSIAPRQVPDKRLTVNSQHLSAGADSNEVRVSNPTLPESADDHRKAARLATALLRALASGFASAKLHH